MADVDGLDIAEQVSMDGEAVFQTLDDDDDAGVGASGAEYGRTDNGSSAASPSMPDIAPRAHQGPLSDCAFLIGEVRLVRVIGQGSFGVVMEAVVAGSGQTVAIKRIRCDSRDSSLINRELTIARDIIQAGVVPYTVSRRHHRKGRLVLQWSHPDKASTSATESTTSSFHRSFAPSSFPPEPPLAHAKALKQEAVHPPPTHQTLSEERDVRDRYHPNIVRLLAFYYTAEEGVEGGNQEDCGNIPTESIIEEPLNTRRLHQHHQVPLASSPPAPVYLHLMMSFLPLDLRRLRSALFSTTADCASTFAALNSFSSSLPVPPPSQRFFPRLLAKLVLFQVARALAFLHAQDVCHRDLKPANILVEPKNGRVQVCDLGSAKVIRPAARERNTSYVCSRFYRAPELLFGSMTYGSAVDIWSLGCLIAELMRRGGRPLFCGRTTVDQMAEIFKVLGTPSVPDMMAMNPQCAVAMRQTVERYTSCYFGEAQGKNNENGVQDDAWRIEARPWKKVLGIESPESDPINSTIVAEAAEKCDHTIDLLSNLLCFDPSKRFSAVMVVEHPFFDELFTQEGQPPHRLTAGGDTVHPDIFTLTRTEMKLYSASFCRKMTLEAEKIKQYS